MTARKSIALAGAALAALILGTAATPSSAAPVTKHDVTIPASDGVNLSGDVYLPGARGRLPSPCRAREPT